MQIEQDGVRLWERERGARPLCGSFTPSRVYLGAASLRRIRETLLEDFASSLNLAVEILETREIAWASAWELLRDADREGFVEMSGASFSESWKDFRIEPARRDF